MFRNGRLSKTANKSFRNKVTRLVVEAKQNCYKSIFSSCQSSIKKSWEALSEFMGRETNKTKMKKLISKEFLLRIVQTLLKALISLLQQ